MRLSQKNNLRFFILIVFFCLSSMVGAATTERIVQIDNSKVKAWKTIVYPTKKMQLPMHRHENDRVVVALTDGVLKVTNDNGHVHFLKLKKGMSYFLTKDPKGEMHVDENITHKSISVVVVELK